MKKNLYYHHEIPFHENCSVRKNVFKLLSFLTITLILCFSVVLSKAQVTTNGSSGLQTSYPNLQAAIAALNSATISSPVFITLQANETTPVGGYTITAQGTAANPISIIGNGKTVTAATQNIGSLSDAIFKLIGADFITLDGITMNENTANTSTDLGGNTMTEFGVAFFYESFNNGAQNNTVKSCNISLNSSYPNSIGIFSTTQVSASNPTVSNPTSNSLGSNSFNKIYGNIISNVNLGVAFIGSGNTGVFDDGNEIGGTTAASGNQIKDWGKSSISAPFPGFGTHVTGVYMNHQVNDSVSNNTIISSSTASLPTQLFAGILKDFTSSSPIIATTSSYNNNTITLNNNGATSGQMSAIASVGLKANPNAIIHIDNNTIKDCVNKNTATTPSSRFAVILSSSAPNTLTINNNEISNYTTNSTGGIAGIQQQVEPVGGSLTINGNKFGASGNYATFSNAVTAGSIAGIIVPATGIAATCNLSVQNNDITGINTALEGNTNHLYISIVGKAATSTISYNTFTNLIANTTSNVYFINNNNDTPIITINNNKIVGSFSKPAAGANVYGIYNFDISFEGLSVCSNNDFSNVTLAGSTIFTGIRHNTTSLQPCTIDNNVISNIKGGTGDVYGIFQSFGKIGSVISNNKVFGINSQGLVYGINFGTGAGTVNATKNLVYDLKTTGTAVHGISIPSGTDNRIIANKIYNIENLSPTGAANGIIVSGGSYVTLYNNIVGNIKNAVANGPNLVNGINLTAGTNINAYYNTVKIDGSSSGAVFGSSALSASTVSNLTLINNILVNNATANGVGLATAYRRSTTTLTTYKDVSNTNLFYGSTIFTDGTNIDSNMASYKARVASRDAASVTENPTWSSTVPTDTNYLHISTTVPTQIESGGTLLNAFTNDFDGDTRSTTNPDIGADEFTGIAISSVKINSASTNLPTAQCTATGRTVTTNITTGATDLVSAVLNYSFNGTPQAPITMTGGNNTAGTTSNFTANIPVAVPANATVTWSITVTDNSVSKKLDGVPYQDEYLSDAVIAATTNNTSVCNGSPAVLNVKITKNGKASIGTGSLTSTGSSTADSNYVSPFSHFYGGYKAQYIIHAHELAAAGLVAGDLTSLSFDVTSVGTIYRGFNLKLGTTTQDNLSGGFVSTTITQVYAGNLDVNNVGVVKLAFGTGTGSASTFTWDGTSNILVNLCWSNNNKGGAAAEVKYDNTPYVALALYREDQFSATTLCGTNTVNAKLSARPKITFEGKINLTPSSITWSNGTSTVGTGNNLSVTPTTATTYSASINYNGCAATSTPVTVNMNIVNNQVTVSGSNLTATETGATYQWMTCTGGTYTNISGATNQTYNASAPGSYAVDITKNGCTVRSACTAVLASSEVSFADQISVFPNPASSVVNFKLGSINKAALKIYDMSRKLLKIENLSSQKNSIDISNLATGNYYFEIITDGGKVTKKIIKK